MAGRQSKTDLIQPEQDALGGNGPAPLFLKFADTPGHAQWSWPSFWLFCLDSQHKVGGPQSHPRPLVGLVVEIVGAPKAPQVIDLPTVFSFYLLALCRGFVVAMPGHGNPPPLSRDGPTMAADFIQANL